MISESMACYLRTVISHNANKDTSGLFDVRMTCTCDMTVILKRSNTEKISKGKIQGDKGLQKRPSRS